MMKHIIMPVIVGTRNETRVHLKLWVSLLIVHNVVAHGQWFNENSYSSISFEDACQSYDINLDGKYFAVILIYIEDFSDLYLDERLDSGNSEEALSTVKSKRREKYHAYMVIVNDMPVCLINFDEEDHNKVKNELSELMSEAKNLVKEKYFIYISVAVGGISKSIDRC